MPIRTLMNQCCHFMKEKVEVLRLCQLMKGTPYKATELKALIQLSLNKLPMLRHVQPLLETD